MREKEHVDECPFCGTWFIGMTPDEFRDRHAAECNPLVALYHFGVEPET